MRPLSLCLGLLLGLLAISHILGTTGELDDNVVELNLEVVRKAAIEAGVKGALHSQLFRWDGVAIGHERRLLFSDGARRTLRTLSLVPLVLEIEEFLNDTEAEMLLAEGRAAPLEASRALKMGTKRREDEYRYSDTAWIRHDSIVAAPITARLAEAAVLPAAWLQSSENIQFVIYPEGGHYYAHHDSHNVSALSDKRAPMRYLTALHALMPADAGGETCFHLAGGRTVSSTRKAVGGNKYERYNRCEGLVLQSLRGNTIIFYNHHLEDPVVSVSMAAHPNVPIGTIGGFGKQDEDSMHGGCEVLAGTKIVANHWVMYSPNNRALVQPLWGPVSSDMEHLALGSLNVGDGIVWIFVSHDVRGDAIRKEAAAVATTMAIDRRLRFVYAVKDPYGLHEADIDFGLVADDFPAAGLLEIGEEVEDDKKFLLRLSSSSIKQVKSQILAFVSAWQKGKAKPLSTLSGNAGEL